MTLYPEHEKLKKVAHLSQEIGSFLDWIEGKGIWLAYYPDNSNNLMPYFYTAGPFLAEYFGIDRAVLEDEKIAMLEAQRALNKEMLK